MPRKRSSKKINRDRREHAIEIKELSTDSCRICKDEICITDRNIIKPCTCNSYVHHECLQTWLVYKNKDKGDRLDKIIENDTTLKCEICNDDYNYRSRPDICLKIYRIGCKFVASNPFFYTINILLPFLLITLWRIDTVLGFRFLDRDIFPITLERRFISTILFLFSILYLIFFFSILILTSVIGCNKFKEKYTKITVLNSPYFSTFMIIIFILVSHILGFVCVKTHIFDTKLITINLNHDLLKGASFFTFSIGILFILLLIAAFIISAVTVLALWYGIVVSIYYIVMRINTCIKENYFNEEIRIIDK